MIRFYDTSSLLLEDDFEGITISSISLQELENIKSSNNKDNEIKTQAKKTLRRLEEQQVKVWIFKETMLKPLAEKGFAINNDLRILACAIDCDNAYPDEVEFYTNDYGLSVIANCFFGKDSIKKVEPKKEEYKGYAEIVLSNEELAQFYQNPTKNDWGLLTNQYLLVCDKQGNEVDIVKWNGERFIPLDTRPINSEFFGKVSAFKGDPQQKMAIDSLHSNQLTVIRGCAASGKSLLGLSYMFSLLEKGKINRLYIFCNPIASRDAAKLGFYPGSRSEKLLDSQIGNFLASKFGDPCYVSDLVEKGKLMLLPASDIRGVSIPSSCGLYITEAQNSTTDLMKLMVQRVEEETKVVIEGDNLQQVDLDSYEGNRNGLHKLVDVFKGSHLFGTVTLKQVHRSELAKLANKI